MWAGVTDFKKSLPSGYSNLDIETYDAVVYDHVTKILTDIQSIDDLFRYATGDKPPTYYPRHGYASGAAGEKSVNIFLQCFAPFDAHFKHYLDEDDLKGIKTTRDFVHLMSEANDRLAEASRDLLATKDRLTPAKPMIERRQKFDQEKELRGRAARSEISTPTREAYRGPRVTILTRDQEERRLQEENRYAEDEVCRVSDLK